MIFINFFILLSFLRNIWFYIIIFYHTIFSVFLQVFYSNILIENLQNVPPAKTIFCKMLCSVLAHPHTMPITSTGNFPAIMTDDVINTIAGMAGFPTDEGSKEALNITNAYLEVPYAENVSEINSILDTYHTSIMNREVTVEEGVASMNEQVGKILNQ